MGSVPAVPIIDVAPFLAGDPVGMQDVVQQVGRACATIGFLVITGHGIDPHLQARTLQVCQEFFDLPEEEKLRYHAVPGTPLGYYPVGSERVAYSRGEETPPDLMATFTLGRLEIDECDPYYSSQAGKQHFPPNVWPARPAQFRAIVTEHYRATERLAKTIMEICALALQLPRHYFADKLNKSLDFWRAIDYPALTVPPVPGQCRIGAHTDSGTLTLVSADSPGLQVQTTSGHWEDVPYLPGSLQVNIGDMMARWSNDQWISTMHRVLPPEGSAEAGPHRRMAIPFFLVANYDVVIAPLATCCDPTHPPRYPPITAGEHLFAKASRQFTRTGEAVKDIRERAARQA